MNWSNYHGHCNFCDGKGSPQDYVKEAIEKKMMVLGISSHAPVPFETTWTMNGNKLPAYLQQIEDLKKLYRDYITVLKSLEVDYIPGLAGPLKPQITEANLDYVIGSVHYVEAFNSGINWSIDNNNSEFEAGVEEIFKGDIKLAIRRYFDLQQEMCQFQTPDILGHMDKIKMHNKVKHYFDEDSQWFKQMVYDTLKLAQEKDIIVEINSKYYTRSNILFPGKEHFKWMNKNRVKVIISSDAHKPDELTSGFSDVALMLIDAGYS